MLEGLEFYKNSLMVNEVCKGCIFSGKIVKLVVSMKNLDVEFFVCDYCIYVEFRGKEMVLILIFVDFDCKKKGFIKEIDCKLVRLRIFFRFGMLGKFIFGLIVDMYKYVYLNFYLKEKLLKVLSFVDVRRFVYLVIKLFVICMYWFLFYFFIRKEL